MRVESMLEMTASDYQLVAEAIHYLEANRLEQPSLDALAQHLAVSPYHLQRVFKRWAGISPKRFLQFLTVEHAKMLLAASHSVLDAALESGLSGPGRLHDLFVNVEAMTPGEFKLGGASGRGSVLGQSACTTRKPVRSFLDSGSQEVRFAERRSRVCMECPPPRITRKSPSTRPTGSVNSSDS